MVVDGVLEVVSLEQARIAQEHLPAVGLNARFSPEDFARLSQCPNPLLKLRVEGIVRKLEPLRTHPELEEVWLDDTDDVSSYAVFEALPKLKKITLRSCRYLGGLSPFLKLRNLSSLTFGPMVSPINLRGFRRMQPLVVRLPRSQVIYADDIPPKLSVERYGIDLDPSE
jgi:hypothetical protein